LVLAHFAKRVEFLGLRGVWVGAFEKMKCIFSIASVGNLEKLRAPGAGVGSTGRWSRASGVVSVCGSGVQSAPDAGTGRWVVTVCPSGVE